MTLRTTTPQPRFHHVSTHYPSSHLYDHQISIRNSCLSNLRPLTRDSSYSTCESRPSTLFLIVWNCMPWQWKSYDFKFINPRLYDSHLYNHPFPAFERRLLVVKHLIIDSRLPALFLDFSSTFNDNRISTTRNFRLSRQLVIINSLPRRQSTEASRTSTADEACISRPIFKTGDQSWYSTKSVGFHQQLRGGPCSKSKVSKFILSNLNDNFSMNGF